MGMGEVNGGWGKVDVKIVRWVGGVGWGIVGATSSEVEVWV